MPSTTIPEVRRATGWPLAVAVWLMPLALLAACSSVNTQADRQIAEHGAAKPDVVLIADFAVTPEEVEAPAAAAAEDVSDAAESDLGLVADEDQSSPGIATAEGELPLKKPARLALDRPLTAAERAAATRFRETFTARLVEAIDKLGLKAERAGAAPPKGASALDIAGRFISYQGAGPSAGGIVGFAADWPDVVADVQILDTASDGTERLLEDREIGLGADRVPPELLPAGVITAQTSRTDRLSPQDLAKIDDGAARAAATVAGELAQFFAGQGWIAEPAAAATGG